METLLVNLKDLDADIRRAAAEELKDSPNDRAVDALIETLSDENRGVAETAENSLLHIRGELVMQKIIPLLSSEKPNLRNFSFEILSEMGSDHIDSIINLLKDDDKDLRKFSADILGELANIESVSALIDSLDDADINVAAAAAESLGKVNDDKAIPELIKKIDSDIWMQCSVIKSLSMFSDERASKEVYDMLPKLKGMALFSAVSALGEVGSKSAIPILISLLNEENKAFKSSIISSLEKIMKREGAQSIEFATDKIEVSELFDLLEDDQIQTKLSAINVLGWLNNEAAVKPLLNEYIKTGNENAVAKEDIKEHLFRAIININPGNISDITATLATIDTSDEIKAELIDILGQLKKEEALDSILNLKDSIDPVIRRVIAKTLGNFDTPDSIKTLKEMLKDKDGHARGSSAKSLGRLKVDSAVDDLISIFDDEYKDIREIAVMALAEIGSMSVINKLTEISSGSGNSEMQELALLGLSKTDNPMAVNTLLTHLKDSDPKMRIITINAISDHNAENCSNDLISMIDDENDDVKVAAISGLAKAKGSNIIDKLIEVLRQSTHLKIRYHIVEVLGKMKATQATQVLLDLLDDESSVIVLSAIEALGDIQDERALDRLNTLCENATGEIATAACKAADSIDKGF